MVNFSGHPWSGSSRLEADPHKRDVAFLDAYSSERWNTILHYMVGSAQQEGISKDAVAILSSAQLVVNEGGSDGSPSITRSGFQVRPLIGERIPLGRFTFQI